MTISKPRKILVTSALIYANGSLHLGHLVEYVQTDIWARYQRLRGNTCYYICGSDAHGTPIMLQAEKRGITPEALITSAREEQLRDFKRFHIQFDHFSTTHSSTNQQCVENIYAALEKKGNIERRSITQFFDPERAIFLPDRFIKGECPKCGAADQYGDGCEKCGATYNPSDLKNPRSAVSGAVPIEKESEHYFFNLPLYTQALETWTRAGHLQPEIANKLDEWFTSGLQAWDISRDAPYFGFKVPNTDNKYFYVWLDAPIGYISAFKEFCELKAIDFNEFWKENSSTELYHFIGKDIVYFHALFWPAMLMGAHYRTPTSICVHGMLTVNGQKMSKSRGTFIKAETYLEQLDPEYLRYYYAAKLSHHVSDLDLNLDDFRLRINADLVGKVVNIASRCASFINKYFDHTLSNYVLNPSLLNDFVMAGDVIAEHYENRDYAQAVREIMALADRANQFIDAEKPWQAIKVEAQQTHVHHVCSLALNLFRLLMVYLQPILPNMADKVKTFLNDDLPWDHRQQALLDHRIAAFSPLMQRVDEKNIAAMLEASKIDLQS
jgi:methionyl-tRNA synthetase